MTGLPSVDRSTDLSPNEPTRTLQSDDADIRTQPRKDRGIPLSPTSRLLRQRLYKRVAPGAPISSERRLHSQRCRLGSQVTRPPPETPSPAQGRPEPSSSTPASVHKSESGP